MWVRSDVRPTSLPGAQLTRVLILGESLELKAVPRCKAGRKYGQYIDQRRLWEGVVKNKYEELRLRRLQTQSLPQPPSPSLPRRRSCLIFKPDHVRTLNRLRACRPRSLPHRRPCRLFLPGQRMRTPPALEDNPEEAAQLPCLGRRQSPSPSSAARARLLGISALDRWI